MSLSGYLGNKSLYFVFCFVLFPSICITPRQMTCIKARLSPCGQVFVLGIVLVPRLTQVAVPLPDTPQSPSNLINVYILVPPWDPSHNSHSYLLLRKSTPGLVYGVGLVCRLPQTLYQCTRTFILIDPPEN